MKLTTIKLIGFGLILMFGMSSCQSFNCGCPMAEVKEVDGVKERGREGEMLRIGESERGRLGEGESGELEIAD